MFATQHRGVAGLWPVPAGAEQLARRGVVGRSSVDFAAAGDAGGRWQVFALEVNLRKGGTTHPCTVLRNPVPGRYDSEHGRWLAIDGSSRWYWSTANRFGLTAIGRSPEQAAELYQATKSAVDGHTNP